MGYSVKINELPKGMPRDIQQEIYNRIAWGIGACQLTWASDEPDGHNFTVVEEVEIEVNVWPVDIGYQPEVAVISGELTSLPAYVVEMNVDGDSFFPIYRHPLGGYLFYC